MRCRLALNTAARRDPGERVQNKLHRNAGPEDLAATEAMLSRVTAPGADYSADFVAEFRTFTRELRDFFNAGAFTDMLALLRPSLPDDATQVRAPALHPMSGRGCPVQRSASCLSQHGHPQARF